jgi:predicted transcriptional regulator
MPRATRETPPPLELLCLRALWTLGEGAVKDVREAVCASRPLAYTTIMTVLERLVRKGRLVRRKAGRAYVYVPSASREEMRQVAVRELLDGFFDGSESQLAAFLAGPGWRGKASAAVVGGNIALAPAVEAEPEVRLDAALL